MLEILMHFGTVSMIDMDKNGYQKNGLRVSLMATMLAVLLFVCAGCSGDSRQFVGVWDLCSMEGSGSNQAISNQDIQAMRELGFETYLNLDEDGSIMLVNFDKAQRGSWKTTGNNSASATIDGQQATILIEGEKLRLTQQDVTLVFERGNEKDLANVDVKLDQASEDETQASEEVGSETRSSELSDMIVRGMLFEKPLTVVDDEICTIVIDGNGVDKWGDPGYNVQITNNSSTNIDVWIKDAFSVGKKRVRAYLFETISPRRSVTSFIQFDTDDLESTNVASLEDVRGQILVDNDQSVTIARYKIVL